MGQSVFVKVHCSLSTGYFCYNFKKIWWCVVSWFLIWQVTQRDGALRVRNGEFEDYRTDKH